jgi:hypothetical protein
MRFITFAGSLGVVGDLPPIEAFKKSIPSKEDLKPNSVRVGDTSVAADLAALVSNEMSI